MAERSRLRNEGMFVPHTTHEGLMNQSDEHREVAMGSKLADHTGVGASEVEEERVV